MAVETLAELLAPPAIGVATLAVLAVLTIASLEVRRWRLAYLDTLPERERL
jgi:hypothetical protein